MHLQNDPNKSCRSTSEQRVGEGVEGGFEQGIGEGIGEVIGEVLGEVIGEVIVEILLCSALGNLCIAVHR